MVLHLAEHLEIPLRERNGLLLAAGYAPLYPERSLDTDEMQPVRQALDRFLRAHEPYPAIVIDRHHNLLASNDALGMLIEGVAPELLEPPANALRIALHPDGMAPRTVNLGEWSAHLLQRLRREARITGDPELDRLHQELASYPGVEPEPPHEPTNGADIVLPLRLRAGERRARVLQHALDLRYRGRHHARRTGDRSVLPRQRPHRHATAQRHRRDRRDIRRLPSKSAINDRLINPAAGSPAPGARRVVLVGQHTGRGTIPHRSARRAAVSNTARHVPLHQYQPRRQSGPLGSLLAEHSRAGAGRTRSSSAASLGRHHSRDAFAPSAGKSPRSPIDCASRGESLLGAE